MFCFEFNIFFLSIIIFYKQIGTPMGSPLSPIIVEIILQDLETSAIDNLPIQPLFYYRYVNDIVLMAPSDYD